MSFSQEGDLARDIFYVNFNQSGTALCVGARSGFNLYDLSTVYECLPTYESRIDPEIQEQSAHRMSYLGKDLKLLKDVCIIERNFSTVLVAFVKLEKPRNVFLYNYSKGAVIIQKAFPNTVLSVKLNRNHVVVCLEDRIFLLSARSLGDSSDHVITDTAPNVKGLLALSWGPEHHPTLVAYPGSVAQGHVQIFDATQKHAKMTIPAHTSQLAALAFDEDGEKLATASIKGTVIRVFSVSTGDVLFEFRRGVKRCVEINCLSFSKNPDLLCASSNTETIHIFKLCVPETVVPPAREDGGEGVGWLATLGSFVLDQSAQYLPAQVTDVLKQPRSFAHIYLPCVDQRTVATITRIKQVPYVLVASSEGFLYIYDINTETGGACHLVKQHRIEGPRHKQESPNSLKSSRSSQEDTHPISPDPNTDPTECLKPLMADMSLDTAEFSSIHTNFPEIHPSESPPVVNGVKSIHQERPLLLTEVE
ncbi:hypothetical protein JTE90_003737 [Oedothorax gibbosus]|uniref:WD repeat domain phosphoinositide-interacting protein 2 n=1 Tax=Oedothorax gibbosus TaxID=931172 RepID=A0AAV6VD44_9ARAC|nr:hypothetical protein JTE90_003737 [Oedothorax gibbosus]